MRPAEQDIRLSRISTLVFRAIIVSAATLLGIFAFHKKGSSDSDELKPFGRMTSEEVLRSSAQLFRVFVPNSKDIRMVTERRAYAGTDGSPHKRWYVECAGGEKGDDEMLHINWDADSSLISWITRELHRSNQSEGHKVDRAEALRESRYWMRHTGVAAYAKHWQLANADLLWTGAWDVCWHAKDFSARTTIDSRTGDLTSLRVQPCISRITRN